MKHKVKFVYHPSDNDAVLVYAVAKWISPYNAEDLRIVFLDSLTEEPIEDYEVDMETMTLIEEQAIEELYEESQEFNRELMFDCLE